VRVGPPSRSVESKNVEALLGIVLYWFHKSSVTRYPTTGKKLPHESQRIPRPHKKVSQEASSVLLLFAVLLSTFKKKKSFVLERDLRLVVVVQSVLVCCLENDMFCRKFFVAYHSIPCTSTPC
jgi:hypothetical protein